MVLNPLPLNLSALTSRWWTLVVRGSAGILFGALALLWPRASLLALVILWGAYALVDGIFNVALATRSGRAGDRWGWLVFEGIVGIIAGVITFVWAGLTAVALLFIIAAWAVITGIAEIAAAIELRRVIHGEWLLAVSGILSIAFGVLMVVYPSSGALALVWLIAIYAIVFGIMLIGLGFRVRAFGRMWMERAEGRVGAPAASRRSPAEDTHQVPPPCCCRAYRSHRGSGGTRTGFTTAWSTSWATS